MASLASGAHNAGNYTLNYDIDYSFLNYSSGSWTVYNGLNVAAVGTPTNYNLNIYITTNPIFYYKIHLIILLSFQKRRLPYNA